MDDTKRNIGGFQRFVKPANRIIDKISVTTGGVVGFSASFSVEHKLANFKSVVLYWNADKHEVGIEFSSLENDSAPKLRANNNGDGFTVNGKAFFAVNHIDTEKYHGRYSYKIISFTDLDPSHTGNEKMYVLDIQESQPNKILPPLKLNPTPSPNPTTENTINTEPIPVNAINNQMPQTGT